MAHPYGQVAIVERILRTGKQKVKFGSDIGTDAMTAADRDSYIEDSDDWVDFKLKRFYTIPLGVGNAEADIVKLASSYRSAYSIWRDVHGGNRTGEEFPVSVLEWKEYAEDIINSLVTQAEMGEFLAGETLATTDVGTSTQAKSSHLSNVYDEDVTFTKLDWAYLNHAQIRKYSEEIYNRTTSSDTSDGYTVGSTKYTRDTDYEIDFPNGKVRRILAGSITDGQTVRIKKYEYVKDYPSEGDLLSPDLSSDYDDEYLSARGYK